MYVYDDNVATAVVCRSGDRLKDKVSALCLQLKQLQAENGRLRQLVNLNQDDTLRDFNTFFYIFQSLCGIFWPKPNETLPSYV
jgi:hypothetical protein